ncbi:MAG: radical SAM protein, partial [Acidilobaceae archaeon]
TGRGTVSFSIKGKYGRGLPSKFTSYYRPIVFWNLTYRCNLSCVHCYISAFSQKHPNELSLEEALNVAREIGELGLPMVVLSGGEPLLREDFWNIAEVLRDYGVRLALSTNGTLITENVAEKLAKLEFSYVGISLDSVDKEKHDVFRGARGAFERALAGVSASIKAGLNTGFRMTITKDNVEEATELVWLSRKLEVKRIAYYVLDATGRALKELELMPTPEQLKVFVENLIDVSRETGGDPEVLVVRANFVGIHVADLLSRTKEEFLAHLSAIGAQGDCGRKTISIYPDGKVKPCQFLDWVDVGDLRKQSLREVLNPENSSLKPFLKIHENLRGAKCSKCVFKLVCGGGSRGRALAYGGDMWEDDPLCYIDVEKVKTKWGVSEADIENALAQS